MRKPSKSGARHRENVRFIPPSYDLKAKAPLTNRDLNEVIARAQVSVQQHLPDFQEVLDGRLRALQSALAEVTRTMGAAEAVSQLDRECHELRGLGTTFGYGTLTDICQALCLYLESRKTLSEKGIDVARLHVDAAVLAAERRLSDSEADGQQVLQGLRKVIAHQE